MLDLEEYIKTLSNEDDYVSSSLSFGSGNGVCVDLGNDEFSIILGDVVSPYIYRGENKDYGKTKLLATENRINRKELLGSAEYCIQSFYRHDFLSAFKRTPFYCEFCNLETTSKKKFKFDLNAICQHYGFISKYVDFTKNLWVALFFAYTFVDKETGKYAPINDFKIYEPCLYIGNIKEIYSENKTSFRAIGFQAAIRIKMQEATAIVTEDLNIDRQFQRIVLPKSVELASAIYSMMYNGQVLFPPDIIANIAKEVKQNRLIEKEYIRCYAVENKLNYHDLIIGIKEKGYDVVDSVSGISFDCKCIETMKRQITKNIMPYLKSRIDI